MYTKSLGLTLTLALAVMTLGYVNPSFADKPTCGESNNKHCDHGDDVSDPPIDITVELIGGAFVFHEGPADVTPNSEGVLRGDNEVHLIRPGGTVIPDLQTMCARTDDQVSTNGLCMIWNDVFNVCGLFGTEGVEEVPEFTAPGGRKGWWVGKVVDGVSVKLGFEVFPPIEISDSPLRVSLKLTGDYCLDPECGIIPEAGGTLDIPLDRYSIHLRGKGGVTHNADCHTGNDFFLPGGALIVRIKENTSS